MFSAGMDLFLEQDQEMSPPHLFRGRKVTGRNVKKNQHGVLWFPEGIRRNELSWEPCRQTCSSPSAFLNRGPRQSLEIIS